MRLYRALVAGEIDQFQMQKRYLRKDGEQVWVQLNVSLVPGATGTPRFTVGMMEDITARKRAEENLRGSEQRFRTLAESSPDAILIHQDLCIVLRQSRDGRPDARECARRPDRPVLDLHAVGRNSVEAGAAAQRGALCRASRSRAPSRSISGWTARRSTSRSRPRPLALDGRPAAHVTVRDITERKRDEERIEYLATHDALTGLPNRTLLDDRFTQTIAQARRTERQLAVLFIDLDRFKLINDTLGHAAGDELLKAVGERLGGVRARRRHGRAPGRRRVRGAARRPAQVDDAAQRRAEDPRGAASTRSRCEGSELFVTASIGIASIRRTARRRRR